MKTLNISTWNRRAHFEHFRDFSDPFFNITAHVDITNLVHSVKRNGWNFFPFSFYLVLKIVNEIESFRYRIREDTVVVHDSVYGACTVLNDDETFSFCYFDFSDNFEEFMRLFQVEIDANQKSESLDPRLDRDDLIHGSVIPWVSFTGFEHAKRIGSVDSIPKIVLGRFFENNGKIEMPISVAVNHALMDGIHVGKFFQKYQEYSENSEQILNC